MEIQKSDKSVILERAKRHYFSLGVGDGCSYLCRYNMRYGLSKIHWAQEQLGMEPNATFISSPDESVTRNSIRWENGMGYGGKLSWGGGESKTIFLDSMPNACGMLVGGLKESIDPKILIERIHKIENEAHFIDDVEIQWDFGKSNHFIDIFSIKKIAVSGLPDYAFIIHCGSPELKGDNAKNIGLYYYRSQFLKDVSKEIETPFGISRVLIDNDAEEYMKSYQNADEFVKRKRILAADLIFGDYETITNPNHQALINYNEHILGTHDTTDPLTNGIFPIALRSDLHAYLMKGLKNLDKEVIEAVGFTKRANELGVYNRLTNANLLPHGGGYAFKHLSNIIDVIETENKRYFIVDMQSDVGTKILSNVRDIEFTYRGKEVVIKTLELMLGEPFAKLVPIYILKI